MKKIILVTVIISMSVFFISCSTASSDPKATLVTFFESLSKKDIAGARKMATQDSKAMLDIMEMGLSQAKEEKGLEKFDKSKMEIGETKVVGDIATIPVKEKQSGEAVNFTLKKEAGTWKVAFDMATLLKMGTEKLKEKGHVSIDSLANQMDELKNMNTDSLKEVMDKGMLALDSLKKILKKN